MAVARSCTSCLRRWCVHCARLTHDNMRTKSSSRLLVALAFGTLVGVGYMSSWRKHRQLAEDRATLLDR